jgi:hypothetical protein
MYKMRVGYSKLGRVVGFEPSKWKMAGEAEAVNILYRLAKRNSDIEFHVSGKSSGQPNPQYPNIVTYWDEHTPKSAWGVSTTAESGRQCNYCKEPAPVVIQRLTCCNRAKEASEREDYLAEVTAGLDAVVTHLGQHGTSHNFIPKVGKTWANTGTDDMVRPYVWAFNYGGYLARALNRFGDEHDGGTGRTVWLCADPRNYLNGRDVKWPTGLEQPEPVLAQYSCTLNGVHERWRDPRTPAEMGYLATIEGGLWRVEHHYRQSGLDMAMLPDDWENWPGDDFESRRPVGVVSTAAYLPDRKGRRSAIIADWVMKAFPDAPIWGKWDDRSIADLPDDTSVTVNDPADFPKLLGSLRTTVIVPPTPQGADGQKWCTAKPWQAFAARTVAFMIPPVDAQGWIIPASAPCKGAHSIAEGLWSIRDDWTEEELHLARWLRPLTPENLALNIRVVSENPETWEWLVTTQHSLLRRRWGLMEVESNIERRLKLR